LEILHGLSPFFATPFWFNKLKRAAVATGQKLACGLHYLDHALTPQIAILMKKGGRKNGKIVKA